MKDKKHKINWSAIISTIIIFAVIILVFLWSFDYYTDKYEYCKSKGYDLFSSSSFFSKYPDNCNRCAREVISDSGLGTEKEYSGCID